MIVGRKIWTTAGGHIPLESRGREPAFTSRDTFAVLNSGSVEAELQATLFYAERDPVGPYCFTVGGERVRQVRINDLIDPEAVPLGTDYGLVIEASQPVVVQFTRRDTSRSDNALLGTMAWPADEEGPGVIGRHRWVIADGDVPPPSANPEGVREEALILNPGEGDARIELTLFHAGGAPARLEDVEVPGRRVGKVRLDSVVDPTGRLRGTHYAALFVSDRPIIVQQLRVDTRQRENSLMTTFGHCA